MKKPLIIIIVVLLFLVVAVILVRGLSGEDAWLCENGQWAKHGQPAEPAPTIGCGLVSVSPTAAPPSSIVKGNLILLEPYGGAEVSLPFMVSGEARVFENMVSMRVKDKGGNIVFSTSTQAQSPDVGQFGPFEQEIASFSQSPVSNEITLEVFWSSFMDGSDMDLISIPLKIKQ